MVLINFKPKFSPLKFLKFMVNFDIKLKANTNFGTKYLQTKYWYKWFIRIWPPSWLGKKIHMPNLVHFHETNL